MSKFAIGVLPEMEAILRHNGIDVSRVTEASLHHNVKDAVTEIKITMLALRPEAES